MSNPVAENRLGRFYLRPLPSSHRESFSDLEYEGWVAVLSGIIPVRCEALDYETMLEFHAYGPDFEVRKPGTTVPEYVAICHRGDDGEITVSWEKQ